MKPCKNPKCKIEFTPSSSNHKYCSKECKDIAGYKKKKEVKLYEVECANPRCEEIFITKYSRKKYCSANCNSNTHYHDREVEVRICSHRDCEKEFIPADRRAIYCSKNCAKAESKKRLYLAPIIHKKTCEYRNCGKEFETTKTNKKYCSASCTQGEYKAKVADMNPHKRQYTSHARLLNEKQHREKRFEIKTMSAKWLQDAWEKVRHEYIKDAV